MPIPEDQLRAGRGHVQTPSATVPLEIAAARAARTRGLLGRDRIDGALLLTATRSVHTLGMRFTIDVAYLDDDLRVTDQQTLPPNRIAAPRWRARHVLEAAAGALACWGIQPGCQLSVGPWLEGEDGADGQGPRTAHRSAGLGRGDRARPGIVRTSADLPRLRQHR